MDCSGSLVYALKEMGYDKIPRFTIEDVMNGDVDFVKLNENVDSSRQGEEGMLNFYDWGDGVEHVNVGVGKRGSETSEQVVDATEGSWMTGRNSEEAQNPKAGSGRVNKTFVPYTRNAEPAAQGQIDWQALEKYKGDKEE